MVCYIHGSENVSEGGRRRRERTMSQYPGVLNRREDTDDVIDEAFTLAEMVRAINRTRPTSPGEDQVCYAKASRGRSILKVAARL